MIDVANNRWYQLLASCLYFVTNFLTLIQITIHHNHHNRGICLYSLCSTRYFACPVAGSYVAVSAGYHFSCGMFTNRSVEVHQSYHQALVISIIITLNIGLCFDSAGLVYVISFTNSICVTIIHNNNCVARVDACTI